MLQFYANDTMTSWFHPNHGNSWKTEKIDFTTNNIRPCKVKSTNGPLFLLAHLFSGFISERNDGSDEEIGWELNILEQCIGVPVKKNHPVFIYHRYGRYYLIIWLLVPSSGWGGWSPPVISFFIWNRWRLKIFSIENILSMHILLTMKSLMRGVLFLLGIFQAYFCNILLCIFW